MQDLTTECVIDFDSWKEEINQFVDQVTAELNQLFEQVEGESDSLAMHKPNWLADQPALDTAATQPNELAAAEMPLETQVTPSRTEQPDPSPQEIPTTPPPGPQSTSNVTRETPAHRLASLRERLSQLKSSDEMFADNLNGDNEDHSPADGDA